MVKMKVNPILDPFSGSMFTQHVINEFYQKPKTHSLLLKLTIEPIIHLEPVPGVQDILVENISLSQSHMLLLTDSGSALIKDRRSDSFYRINHLNIIKVQAGNGFSVFLTARGLTLTSGSRCLGRDENDFNMSEPHVVRSIFEVDIVDIAAGHSHLF